MPGPECRGKILPMLVTTRALVERAMRADLAYTMQRMEVIAQRKGNPFGVAFQDFGTLGTPVFCILSRSGQLSD